MEGSIMGEPSLSTPEAGVLELDPSFHHAATLHHHQQTLSHHLQGLAPLSTTQHLNVNQDIEPSLGLDSKCTPKAVLICSKGKSAGTSDEDEPSFAEEGDCHLGGKGKKGSPWQRMKWTDSMVKLLIHVVILIGEDGTNDTADGNKRKSGILQKKGKWKSVSRVMNDKGCYVSPQQCEDKFNDLNKRYKRLNDILGKGTACCVVEDPSLLDTMDNLPLKSKDDVRKILSSKQLFYRDICAYHSGCKSLVSAADFEFQPLVQAGNLGQSGDFVDTGRHQNDVDGDDDDEDDADDEEEDDYEDHAVTNCMDTHTDVACGFTSPFGRGKKSFKNLDGLSGSLLNYTKAFSLESSSMDQMLAMQDGANLMAEQQQLIRTRMMQLEEQKVGLLAQALDLEKQQFKWERLSSKKYRELEQLRLDNKKMKLENERISLQLKQKELEAECKRSEVSMNSIDLLLERLQSKELIEYGRGQAMG